MLGTVSVFQRACARVTILEPLLQIVKQHAVPDIDSSAVQRTHVLAPTIADPAGKDGLLFSAAMIGGLAPQPLPMSAANTGATSFHGQRRYSAR